MLCDCSFRTAVCVDVAIVCLSVDINIAADVYVSAEKVVSVLLKRQVQQAVSIAGVRSEPDAKNPSAAQRTTQTLAGE